MSRQQADRFHKVRLVTQMRHCAGVKKIGPTKTGVTERYRLALSDGERFVGAHVAAGLNALVTSNQLRTNSIVRLQTYNYSTIQTARC